MQPIATNYFRLYRAVSPPELADILASGIFSSTLGALEGKWFAEEFDQVVIWGNLLYSDGRPFHVVYVDVPQDVADQMFRIAFLDRIGPARYADADLLVQVNQTNLGIVEQSVP